MTQAASSLPIETDANGAVAVAQRNMDADALPDGLTAEDLVEVCRQMVLVRTMDERIWMMNRQGKVPIAASCQGHEAAELGSLLAAQKDGDCFLFPYYRDLGSEDGRRTHAAPGHAVVHGKGGRTILGRAPVPAARS